MQDALIERILDDPNHNSSEQALAQRLMLPRLYAVYRRQVGGVKTN
jgi:hypothetical protein